MILALVLPLAQQYKLVDGFSYDLPGGQVAKVVSISHVTESSITTWRPDGKVDNFRAGQIWADLTGHGRVVAMKRGSRNLLVEFSHQVFGEATPGSFLTVPVAMGERVFQAKATLQWGEQLPMIPVRLHSRTPWAGGMITLEEIIPPRPQGRAASFHDYHWKYLFSATPQTRHPTMRVEVKFVDKRGEMIKLIDADRVPTSPEKFTVGREYSDPVGFFVRAEGETSFEVVCSVNPKYVSRLQLRGVRNEYLLFHDLPAYPADK